MSLSPSKSSDRTFDVHVDRTHAVRGDKKTEGSSVGEGKKKGFYSTTRSKLKQQELELASLLEKVHVLHTNLNKLTYQNNQGQSNDNDQFQHHANVFSKMIEEHAKDHSKIDLMAVSIEELQKRIQ